MSSERRTIWVVYCARKSSCRKEGRVEIELLSRKTPVPRKQLRNGLAMNSAERWRLQTSSCDDILKLALGRRIGIERIVLEDSKSV